MCIVFEVQSDTLLEMATLNVDDCFADLVYWAWEDASTASTQVQGGTTFLTALDCDKAESISLSDKSMYFKIESVTVC